MSPVWIPLWAWGALAAVLLVCLTIDLVAHRGDHVDSRRRAVAWSVAWIAVALLFNLGVGLLFGREAAEQFLAAYLLEKSLSVDNLFIFLLLFGRLAIPHEQQRRVLTWGILGALVTRGVFIALGAAAIQRWHWVLYVFGALLIVVAVKMLRPGEEEEGKVLPFLERHLRYTQTLRGPHFFVREAGRRVATPLFLALLAVEVTDVIFAVDSIPAAFSVTTQPFLVYSSNVFAILGLRSLYIVLSGALSNLRYLRYGLSAVLCFAGAKMLAARWMHVPSWLSLLVIVGCIGIAVIASRWARRNPSPEPGGGAKPKRWRTLRTKLGVGAALLAALALAAAAALIALTTLLNQEVSRLSGALARVQTAEELRGLLIDYDRTSHLWALSGDPRYEENLVRHRKEIEALLGQLAGEEDAVWLVRDIHEYLRAEVRPGRETPGGLAGKDPRAPLDGVDASLDLFVEQEVRQANRAQRMADRWNELGNLAGLGSAALLLIGVGAALVWAQRKLYRPLERTRQTIAAHNPSARGARAPEDGPEEIAQIARAFNETAERLERERDGRVAFLAAVAHELRTPLSALKVATASMARQKPGADSEAARARLLGMMDRQISRLDRMLGDLIFAARAEAGRMELSFDLRDLRVLVRDSLELYQTYSDQHELRMELPDAPVWLRCDPVRLEQVLVNLVSNAFKYSPAGGCVRVTLERQGDEAMLAVSDQGIGISPEDAARIFEPFQRVGTLRDRVPGVGLGLAVTRRLVEAHGGRIEVESTSGKGSTFRVRLPVITATAEVEPSGEQPPPIPGQAPGSPPSG